MFAVARRQGIPVQELAAANGLPINAQLREGQRIKIPSGVKPASAPAPKSAPKSAPKAAPKAAPAAPTPQFEPLQLRPLGAPAAAKPAPAAEPAPAPAPAPKAAN
jgi:murein DD-endopeptidase MepM/ murein hydrolase activator NlpD